MKQDIIKLGDGKEYTIGEFNVGDFITIEEKYGNLKIDSSKVGPVIYWLWLAIKKMNKDITLEKLYELIPASFISSNGITIIFDALSKLNGWDNSDSKNSQSPVEK